MMVAKTLLKSEAMRVSDPSQVLDRVNSVLAMDNETSMFVTVFCAVLDTETGRLLCSNAGHLAPLIQKVDGTVSYRSFSPGFVLGPMPDIEYRTEEILLQPGELFLLYTDGVTEAINPKMELFGEELLLQVVNRCGSISPKEVINAIRSEVHSFADGAPQSDDITMLAIRYKGKNS
jgi:sigma-B regulation protein RsbU (phosphoserine phosphatase)